MDDALERARSAPIDGSPGVRFALAYLWSISSTSDRHWFDEFWRTVQGRHGSFGSEHISETMRRTLAQTQFNAIACLVGFELTPDMSNRLRVARGAHKGRTRAGK